MIFLLLMTASTATFAAPSTRFDFDGKPISFRADPSRHLLVDETCFAREKKCAAFRAFLKLRDSREKPVLSLGGSANPGSEICRKLAGGEVVQGREKAGVNSFCRFSDGSLLDNGSLTYAYFKK